MFMQERHQLILDLLNQNGKVLVKDLAAQFNLSEDSIRKDLATLESDGLLKRTYGGAISLQEKILMTEANRRRMTAVDQKRKIAALAVSLIKPNQLVFLDISSISIAIADLLERITFPLKVLTNMCDVLAICARNPQIQIFFAGGLLNQARDGFSDPLAIDLLSRFNPDLAFICPFAVDLDNNSVSSRDTNSGLAKAAVLARAAKAFLLAEHDKFNRRAHFRFAALEDFHAIISSAPINATIPALHP